MAEEGAIARRVTVRGQVQGVGFRAAAVRRGRELGVLGWVRNEDDGTVLAHAEGPAAAVDAFVEFLRAGPPGAVVDDAAEVGAKVEGHEQLAVRGVAAGVFVVQEHAATARHFDLRLEVDGVMRSWALPKGPTLDPAVKRLAVQALDRGHAVFVLRGEKLRGGFVLQRTGGGAKPQWLLLKRRDADARSGFDVVAEQPASVVSGRTLDELLG